jgi:hypothetical protein
MNSLLVVFYWVLLLLILLGCFAQPSWTWYPRVNSAVTLVLFVIIGLKSLKPNW